MSAVITPRLRRYFDEYASYHQDGRNKLTHYLGIPVLTVAIPALLAKVVLLPVNEWFRLDLGIILWLLVTVWYVRLSPVLGLAFSAVCLTAYFLARDLWIWWLWAAFALGWVLQFVGHAIYEKKSPAFLKNFEHLFIGPLWVFARATGQTR